MLPTPVARGFLGIGSCFDNDEGPGNQRRQKEGDPDVVENREPPELPARGSRKPKGASESLNCDDEWGRFILPLDLTDAARLHLGIDRPQLVLNLVSISRQFWLG